MSIWKIPVCYS